MGSTPTLGTIIMAKTNWYVITGGPSSGKTSVINLLQKRGYKIVPEAARVFIDQEISKGKSIQELRKDEASFQGEILSRKIQIESQLPPEEIVFLDRAVPDTVVYSLISGVNTKEIQDLCHIEGIYKKVFLMDQLPFMEDYARTEDTATAVRLSFLLGKVYKDLDYEVISVPILPVEERVAFILERL